ncbi:MAG: glycosyltransferase, partial [Clostridia bacterium]|nr:glycosyltransferase [Clostridia bacterium]
MSKISVVVPCYNEQSTVESFYQAATPVLKSTGLEYEIIYVNDGSRDDTLKLLKGLAERDEKVKVLSFSRNFGQQAAI